MELDLPAHVPVGDVATDLAIPLAGLSLQSPPSPRPRPSAATVRQVLRTSVPFRLAGPPYNCLYRMNDEVQSCELTEQARSELAGWPLLDVDFGVYFKPGTDHVRRLRLGSNHMVYWTPGARPVSVQPPAAADRRTFTLTPDHVAALVELAGDTLEMLELVSCNVVDASFDMLYSFPRMWSIELLSYQGNRLVIPRGVAALYEDARGKLKCRIRTPYASIYHHRAGTFEDV